MTQSESTATEPRITSSTTYLFEQIHYALRIRTEAALRKYSTTAIQYTVLSVLANRDGLSSADLSRRFYVTPQSMGQLLSLLEERGLLERNEDVVNRRILRVSLTPAGRALVDACAIEMQQLEAKAFGSLAPPQLDALRIDLHKLVQSLRAQSNKNEIL